MVAPPAVLFICGCHFVTSDELVALAHTEQCPGGPCEMFVQSASAAYSARIAHLELTIRNALRAVSIGPEATRSALLRGGVCDMPGCGTAQAGCRWCKP